MNRDQKTAEIVEVTKIDFLYLQNCSNEEIDRIYRNRVEKKNVQVQR